MRLSDYLDVAMQEPWVWGAMDCCHFAGDWIRGATGRDPLEPYRNRYASAAGAARLIARAGGLARLLDPEMERCGFSRAAVAVTGDIAILPLPGTAPDDVARASVVIADGPWWVGRTREGIVGLRAAPPVVWRVLGGAL